MASADDSIIHLVHTVWSGVLSVLMLVVGWFVRWNWNRIVTELDKKADKEALDVVKQDMDRRHDEMLQVLKEIRDGIANNDREATAVRNALQQSMQSLVGQVGEIKGWIGAQTGKTGVT